MEPDLVHPSADSINLCLDPADCLTHRAALLGCPITPVALTAPMPSAIPITEHLQVIKGAVISFTLVLFRADLGLCVVTTPAFVCLQF